MVGTSWVVVHASRLLRRIRRGWFGGAARIAYALALACMLLACDNRAPQRTLRALRPSVVSSQASTPVVIEGSGFQVAPRVALSTTGRAQLRSGFRVRIGDVFDTMEVERLSAERLGIVVPAGIASGTYDVTLELPSGQTLLLAAGLSVSDDVPATQRTLTLETRGDGQGEPIASQTLKVGQTLELFAVLRDAASRQQVDAGTTVQFTQQPTRGLFSDSAAARSVFTARLPGDVTLRAETEAGESAEVSLHIEADPDARAVQYQLSIEDAAGGMGEPIPAMLEQRAGDTLTCFAIIRDSDGNYVLDVPATWTASGAQMRSFSGPSLRYEFVELGDTTITAVAPDLTDTTASTKVHVVLGPARTFELEPNSVLLAAGGPPQVFVVKGIDASGHETPDTGVLRLEVADGAFGVFDPATNTLTPTTKGVGHLRVLRDSMPVLTSGVIEVTAGKLFRIELDNVPSSVSADANSWTLAALGFDVYSNKLDDLGELTWALTGGIGDISAAGELSPRIAGKGEIEVKSALDPNVVARQPIEIKAGRALSLSVRPQNWRGVVGGKPQQFEAVGTDRDGNDTYDVGTVTYSVGSGPIRSIDPQSGMFTPTVEGQGTISATTSYELSGSTNNVIVSRTDASVKIVAMRASSQLFAGATARVEVDVTNTDVVEVVLTGLGLSVSDAQQRDISSDYQIVADNTNVERIPANATRTFVYYVSVVSSPQSFGAIEILAAGEAFSPGIPPQVVSGSLVTSILYALWGTALTIDAPTPPNDRICRGGRVSYYATANSLFSYTWAFPSGTLASGSSYNDRGPAVDYASVGNYASTVTAAYTPFFITTTYSTLTRGKPVYVGTVTGVSSTAYPTGHVVFTSPSAGQSVASASLPRTDLLVLDASKPVRQCDGSAVPATGRAVLTAFSDRRLIDPAADVDPAMSGIQLSLNAAGTVDPVRMISPAVAQDGASTLSLEYFEPNAGVVTAAGDTTFTLTGDTQPPSVLWSLPTSDCAGACLQPSEPLIVQFSEPMSTSSLSNVRVELFGAAGCSGTPISDLTSSSTRSYEPASRTLSVVPPARTGAYAVRVQLPSSVTDASGAHNPLPAWSRCALVAAGGSGVAPTAPTLDTAPATSFSPDGDQSAESVTWKVNLDATARLVRLRITRGDSEVWAQWLPVAGAGIYTFTWDGSDPSGRIVNNGAYGYAIDAVNTAGTASAALRGYVEVNAAAHLVSVWRRQ